MDQHKLSELEKPHGWLGDWLSDNETNIKSEKYHPKLNLLDWQGMSFE